MPIAAAAAPYQAPGTSGGGSGGSGGSPRPRSDGLPPALSQTTPIWTNNPRTSPQAAQRQATDRLSSAYDKYAAGSYLTAQRDNDLRNQLYQSSQADLSRQTSLAGSTLANNRALLDQDRYRNVDLGFMSNNENRRYITQTWQNLQNYLGGRTTTAQDTWANQRNFYNRMAPLDFRTLGLANQRNLYQTEADLDNLMSQATARGAMSSRGAQSQRFTRENLSRVQSKSDQNEYDIRRLRADTDLEGNRISYQDALNQIANQRATGQNAYTHGISGADIQDLALRSLATTYGLRADQLGIQHDQSLAGLRSQGNQAAIQNQMMNNQFTQSQQQAAWNAIMQQYQLGI